MPGIFVGSTELTAVGDIKIGSTNVQEVYVGATKVFPTAGPSTDFVTRWDTENAGTSGNDQITLPLNFAGSYDFEVDWGDGSANDTITSFTDPAATHTFIDGPGIKLVTIIGVCDGFQFNNGGDRLKLIEVLNWGTFNLRVLGGHFSGCTNMVVSASDVLTTTNCESFSGSFSGCSSMTQLNMSTSDTSSVTNMSSTFANCSTLVSLQISGWNTSSVNNMSQICNGCGQLTSLDVSSFNTALVTNFSFSWQNCSLLTSLAMDAPGWDIGNATNMSGMLTNVTLDTSNYDSILASWAAQSPVQSGVTCSFGGSQYTIATSQANRDILTDPPNNWNLSDGGGI